MTSACRGTKDQKFQRSGGQDVEIEGQKSDEEKPSFFFKIQQPEVIYTT